MKNLIKTGLLLLVIVGVLSGCSSDLDTDVTVTGIDYTDTSEELSEQDVDTLMNTVLESLNEDGINLDKEYEEFSSDQVTVLSTNSITAEGVYLLNGEYSQITIDCEGDVTLLLDNTTIASTDGPAVLVLNADDVTFSSLPNTENTISDVDYYSNIDYNAAIYSKSDLVFNGTGTLTVVGNYNNAINSRDDIKIVETNLVVESVDDGIIGKDYVAVKDATITVTSDGDSIKSTNAEDLNKGYIYIESGTFNLTSNTDTLQAVNAVLIYDGTFELNALDDGISCEQDVVIGDGTLNIVAKGDGINTGNSLVVYAGDVTVAAGDDGLHSDLDLTIEGGTVTVTESYEGIESLNIYIHGGVVQVSSTDDGINGTSGGGQIHGGTYTSTGGYLEITGGIVTVNSDGDGIDINGDIYMTGGYVTTFGTTADNQSSVDYDETCNINGGVFIAVGSTGMIQTVSETSTQNSLIFTSTSNIGSGETIVLTDESGNVLLSLESVKSFAGVVISSPDLETDNQYTLTVSGESEEFTVTELITTLGAGIVGQEPGMGPGGRPGR